MTDELAFPPLRDLPAGRLAARRAHLLDEISRGPERSHSWRSAIMVAVVAAALVGAGVAIAAGFGAFNGLSRTQHPQTAADVLPGKTRISVERFNASFVKIWKRFHKKPPLILPGTARLLGNLPLPGIRNVYAATDTKGHLCIIFEGGGADCTLPLSRSNPVRPYEARWWPHGIWGPVAYGIAIDGITAVTFKSNGHDVTVPVKDNLWYYIGPNSAGGSLTLHFADGSTEVVHECNGQCGDEGPPDPGYPAGLPASDRLG